MHNDALVPLEHPYASTPGSEGLIGNIIRDVVGRRPRFDKAAMYNSRDGLRRWRVRSLLLVDDYSGSGDQLVKYVDAWTDHPTIKSWRSYGLLRVHILVLAASKDALQRLREHRFVEGVQYLEQGGDFDSVAWTGQEQKAIVDLCLRYAHLPAYALGYQEARGLLVLHHTVPNNLPNILWQTKSPKIRDWAPLFADRTMTPQQQVELDDYRLETDPKRIAAIIRQEQLGEALDAQPNPTVRVFLLILGAIEHGYRDPMMLANLLGLTHEATLRTLEACKGLALIDATNRLTTDGRSELRRARTRRLTTNLTASYSGSDVPYYPRTLRGADDI